MNLLNCLFGFKKPNRYSKVDKEVSSNSESLTSSSESLTLPNEVSKLYKKGIHSVASLFSASLNVPNDASLLDAKDCNSPDSLYSASSELANGTSKLNRKLVKSVDSLLSASSKLPNGPSTHGTKDCNSPDSVYSASWELANGTSKLDRELSKSLDSLFSASSKLPNGPTSLGTKDCNSLDSLYSASLELANGTSKLNRKLVKSIDSLFSASSKLPNGPSTLGAKDYNSPDSLYSASLELANGTAKLYRKLSKSLDSLFSASSKLPNGPSSLSAKDLNSLDSLYFASSTKLLNEISPFDRKASINLYSWFSSITKLPDGTSSHGWKAHNSLHPYFSTSMTLLPNAASSLDRKTSKSMGSLFYTFSKLGKRTSIGCKAGNNLDSRFSSLTAELPIGNSKLDKATPHSGYYQQFNTILALLFPRTILKEGIPDSRIDSQLGQLPDLCNSCSTLKEDIPDFGGHAQYDSIDSISPILDSSLTLKGSYLGLRKKVISSIRCLLVLLFSWCCSKLQEASWLSKMYENVIFNSQPFDLKLRTLESFDSGTQNKVNMSEEMNGQSEEARSTNLKSINPNFVLKCCYQIPRNLILDPIGILALPWNLCCSSKTSMRALPLIRKKDGCHRRKFPSNSWILSIWKILSFLTVVIQGVAARPSGNTSWNSSSDCYPCNDYNRKWASIVCENNKNDCGDCYPGYHSIMDNIECLPLGVKVIVPNEIATIPKGSEIVVNCQWPKKIEDCMWTRNGFVVEISGRYQSSMRNEKECSLQIVNFQEIDVAEWSCHIFDDPYENEPSHVAYSWLYLTQPKILHVKPNEVALVPLGQSVVLSWDFETKVDCLWLHDGKPRESDPRYSYVDSIYNGQGTRECSFRIDDLQDVDVGKWHCQSASDSSHGSWNKIVIELHAPMKPAKQMGIQPTRAVKVGSHATLHCGYDVRVDCGWERNGRPIAINDRYRYIGEENGINAEDCSIEISSLAPEDLGEWRCGYKYSQMTDYKMMASTSLLVSPAVHIAVESNRHHKPSVEETRTVRCSAMQAFPVASVYWQLNDDVHLFDAETIEENGMFTTSATVAVDIADNDDLVCIIQHPGFDHPKVLRLPSGLNPTLHSSSPSTSTSSHLWWAITSTWFLLLLPLASVIAAF